MPINKGKPQTLLWHIQTAYLEWCLAYGDSRTMLRICGGFAVLDQNYIEDHRAAPAQGGDLADPSLTHPGLVGRASSWLSGLPRQSG